MKYDLQVLRESFRFLVSSDFNEDELRAVLLELVPVLAKVHLQSIHEAVYGNWADHHRPKPARKRASKVVRKATGTTK